MAEEVEILRSPYTNMTTPQESTKKVEQTLSKGAFDEIIKQLTKE